MHVTQAKLKQGETVFHHKNTLLALKWMDKREVYILSGLHKATNVISKKTNYKECDFLGTSLAETKASTS